MAAHEEVIRFLRKKLGENGPMKIKKLMKHVSQAKGSINKVLGTDATEILAFLNKYSQVFKVHSNGMISVNPPEQPNECANDLCIQLLAKLGPIPINQFPSFLKPFRSEIHAAVGKTPKEIQVFLQKNPHIFFVDDDKVADLAIRRFLGELPAQPGNTTHVATLLLTMFEIFLEAIADEENAAMNVRSGITTDYIYNKLSHVSMMTYKEFENIEAFETEIKPILSLPYFNEHSHREFSLNRSAVTSDVIHRLFILAILQLEVYTSLEILKKRIFPYRLHQDEIFTSGLCQHLGILNASGFVGLPENIMWTTLVLILNTIEEERFVKLEKLRPHLDHAPVTVHKVLTEKGLLALLQEHPCLFGITKEGEVYSHPQSNAIVCQFLQKELRKKGVIYMQDIALYFQNNPETFKHLMNVDGKEALIQLLTGQKDIFSLDFDSDRKVFIKLCAPEKNNGHILPETASLITNGTPKGQQDSPSAGDNLETCASIVGLCKGGKEPDDVTKVRDNGSKNGDSNSHQEDTGDLEDLSITFLLDILEKNEAVSLRDLLANLISAPHTARDFLGKTGLKVYLDKHPSLFGVLNEGIIFSRPKAEEEMCEYFLEKLKKREYIKLQNIHSYFSNAPNIIKNLARVIGTDGVIQVLKERRTVFCFNSFDANTSVVMPHDLGMSITFLLDILEKKEAVSIRVLLENLVYAPDTVRDFLGKIGLKAFLNKHPNLFGVLNEGIIFSRPRAEEEMCIFFLDKLKNKEYIKLQNIHSYFSNAPNIIKYLARVIGTDGVIRVMKERRTVFCFKAIDANISVVMPQEGNLFDVDRDTQGSQVQHGDLKFEEELRENVACCGASASDAPCHDNERFSVAQYASDYSLPDVISLDVQITAGTEHLLETVESVDGDSVRKLINNCEGVVHSVFKSWALLVHKCHEFSGKMAYLDTQMCEFTSELDDMRQHIHRGQDLVFDVWTEGEPFTRGPAICNVRYKSLFQSTSGPDINASLFQHDEGRLMMSETIFKTDLIRVHIEILRVLSLILLGNDAMDVEEIYTRFVQDIQTQDISLFSVSDFEGYLQLHKDLFILNDTKVSLGSPLKKGVVSKTFLHHGYIKPATSGTEVFYETRNQEQRALAKGMTVEYIDIPISSLPKVESSTTPQNRVVLVLVDETVRDQDHHVMKMEKGSLLDSTNKVEEVKQFAALTSSANQKSNSSHSLNIPLDETETNIKPKEIKESVSKEICETINKEVHVPHVTSSQSTITYSDQRMLNSNTSDQSSCASPRYTPGCTGASENNSLAEIPDLFLLTRMMTKLVRENTVSRHMLAKSNGYSSEIRNILKDFQKCKAYAQLHPMLIELSEDGNIFKMASTQPLGPEFKIKYGRIVSVSKNAAYARTEAGESIFIIRKTFFWCGYSGGVRATRDVAKGRMESALQVGDEVTCICLSLVKDLVMTGQHGCSLVIKWQAILTWQTKYNYELLFYTLMHSDDGGSGHQNADTNTGVSHGLTGSADDMECAATWIGSTPPLPDFRVITEGGILSAIPQKKRKKKNDEHAEDTGSTIDTQVNIPVLRKVTNNEDLFTVLEQVALIVIKQEELSLHMLVTQLQTLLPTCQTFLKSRDDLETLLKVCEVFEVVDGSVGLKYGPSNGIVTKLEERSNIGECGFIYGEHTAAFFTASAVYIPRQPHRTCHLDYKVKEKSRVWYIAVPRWLISRPSNVGKAANKRAILVWPQEGANTNWRHPKMTGGQRSQTVNPVVPDQQEQLKYVQNGLEISMCESNEDVRIEDESADHFLSDGSEIGDTCSEGSSFDVGSQTCSTGAIMMTRYVKI